MLDKVTLQKPFEIASQCMKTISRQINIRRVLRLVQMRQDVFDPAGLIGPDAAWVPFEQAFQPVCRNVLIVRVLYPVSIHVSTGLLSRKNNFTVFTSLVYVTAGEKLADLVQIEPPPAWVTGGKPNDRLSQTPLQPFVR